MQCRDVEVVIEQEGLAPLPEAARAHLAGCRHCQECVPDLAAIVSVANKLPAEVEPPARVWVSLRTQLELEGIIKEPVAAPSEESLSWWRGFSGLFRSRALATVMAGALILGAAPFLFGETRAVPSPPPPPRICETTQHFKKKEEELRRHAHHTPSPRGHSTPQKDDE